MNGNHADQDLQEFVELSHVSWRNVHTVALEEKFEGFVTGGVGNVEGCNVMCVREFPVTREYANSG
jgi:hypothetical protein